MEQQHEERRSVNDPFTIRTDIYELCADIIYEQISNQMHIPDGFEGVKEIKLPPIISRNCNPRVFVSLL